MKNGLFSQLKSQVAAAATTLLGWIAIGTVAFRYLEKWSWIEAFYFSVTSLTTVGYGDLHPTNSISQLFTAIYILLGVAIALASLGIIGTKALEKRENLILRRREARGIKQVEDD